MRVCGIVRMLVIVMRMVVVVMRMPSAVLVRAVAPLDLHGRMDDLELFPEDGLNLR